MKDKLAFNELANNINNYVIKFVSYFGSNVAERLHEVVLIIGAHEEPHPVCVPKNLALDKLAVLTTVAHGSVDALWHRNCLLPHSQQVQV